MKFAVSQISTLTSPLEADLPAFAAAGFTAVELSMEKIGRYLEQRPIDDLKALLASLGLQATGAIGLAPKGPALLLSRGQEAEDYFAMLERQLTLSRDLDIPQIGIGADAAKWITDPDWQAGAVDNLRRAADMAADFDVRIGIECLSLGPPIGPFLLASLAETRTLVDQVGRDEIGINVDFFHHYRSGGTAAELATLPGRQIVGVHVTDLNSKPREDLGDGDRELPGEGILPLAEYARSILSTGYDGPWVIELLNQKIWDMPVTEAALALMRSTIALQPQA